MRREHFRAGHNLDKCHQDFIVSGWIRLKRETRANRSRAFGEGREPVLALAERLRFHRVQLEPELRRRLQQAHGDYFQIRSSQPRKGPINHFATHTLCCESQLMSPCRVSQARLAEQRHEGARKGEASG